ncbi:hypothetical protein [Bradyrhizobium sp.]|jgi:phage gpG-like protein|uniref:hypothetical protein n=1 Tax=Bradyrhizobium sp. TaxID=376 RepID=UPI002DDCCDE6|nr:hypothetical protein [Bradyrhizobium sp.]HEV2159471.1 hypothetical protein [Bradyrhizobium sp.]
MLRLFRKQNDRYRRYKQLFDTWERYLLTHETDVTHMSEAAALQAMLNFSPIAAAYGLQLNHHPELLVERVKPADIYAASEECFFQATSYRNEGSERFYQGAVLAGVYFGVAGLVADKEKFVAPLWRRVMNAMSLAIDLAARSTAHKSPDWKEAKTEAQGPLPAATSNALKKTETHEANYRSIDGQRSKELEAMPSPLRSLFEEQQRLFVEVQKASKVVSPAAIYGASISVMSLFERVFSRRGPPRGVGEPEVAAADMAAFMDRLYATDDSVLGQFETLSSRICTKPQSDVALLGAQVTRVVVLGRLLNHRLSASAPLCSHEAQWLANTLLSDLEKLATIEVGKPGLNRN